MEIQSNEVEITKNDFSMWIKHPITVKLYEALRELRQETKDNMTNEQVIMANDCQLRQIRMLGIMEGLDVVLNMELEEVVDEENEEDSEINY